jgi:cysteine-rich repeat protein
VCGNNKVETGEQCDDGNTKNGDGCNQVCQDEEEDKEVDNPDPNPG